MPGVVDTLQLEKALASKTTRALTSSFKSAVYKTTHSRTGEAKRITGSRAVFKFNRLQRIVLKAPGYIFKQNYGFEGTKSNGVNMRLQATAVIDLALNDPKILNDLADGITNIRGEQVLAAINFDLNPNAKWQERK